jgi:hypothetical protein
LSDRPKRRAIVKVKNSFRAFYRDISRRGLAHGVAGNSGVWRIIPRDLPPSELEKLENSGLGVVLGNPVQESGSIVASDSPHEILAERKVGDEADHHGCDHERR